MSDPIRFLFDENVRSDVIQLFRQRGHEIILSREVTGVSAPDQLIAVFGKYESLVIVSHDNDFRKYRQLLPNTNADNSSKEQAVSFSTCLMNARRSVWKKNSRRSNFTSGRRKSVKSRF